ncbi:polyketide synthase [Aspergillus ustus]|uniref:Polyketide synthase n=1 Tax=Aspergillus ustus TaxID=40382 RepID=A0A0C1E595_ASPUT|nr:polyketide synthase [Aspergillus ustus]
MAKDVEFKFCKLGVGVAVGETGSVRTHKKPGKGGHVNLLPLSSLYCPRKDPTGSNVASFTAAPLDMAQPAALVFGPQTTLPSSELACQLRAALLLNPRLYPVRKSIETLPAIWPVLLAADPALLQVCGARGLKDLSRWLSHGEFPPAREISELSSVFVTPFTVILHLVQYLSYTDPKHGGLRHEDVLESVNEQGGVQGFCSGLLAAVTVATSADLETVCHRAEVALRLAVGIGAYIDLDCVDSKISSIAVKSRPATPHNELQDYFEDLESTYVSVVTDASSRTVTTPTALVDAVSQKLKAQGFAMKQVDLRGRFHYPGHARAVETLRRLANSNPDFQLPHTDSLLAPVYSNVDGQAFPQGQIGDTLIESILLHRCDWYSTMSAAFAGLTSEDATVVQFGLVECVPASLLRRARASVQRISSIPGQPLSTPIPATIDYSSKASPEPIAIIGMACKVPGADSLGEFWDLMMKGVSMCTTIPEERFNATGLRRSEDGKLKFYGNFVKDVDAFDHRFFKKSSREAASMDPQQRLLMQVAYQAIESAEYTGLAGSRAKRDIGCYIGACSNDYNDNVASHQPNAFSSLGTLRAFMSGKLSHFFGWTGPSITYDTACSSSAVAIQAACTALQMGECSMALAGGVSFYTNPLFYQNLAAASFLSPTGPTKPFDAKGDGYCRGEGAGLVLLKPLPAAIADHDNIMGVIAAAAVNQNENTTSITVPHTGSQIELYQKVVSDSGLHAHDISYVEAHGTGTPVGDPREITSIREVFGGRDRADMLAIASVKGNIGHLEGASGVASLIKTILMMHHGAIPMQANHTQLNPKVDPLEPDKMIIPLANQPWNAKFKAACINNYGAAGSNAAMIVYEPPKTGSKSHDMDLSLLPKYPIFISANSITSLRAYASVLLQFINANRPLSDLAFYLANRQNRSFPHALITSVSSQSELREQLSAVVEERSSCLQSSASTTKPVVFVFGGQTSTSIGLSGKVYDSSALLRSHLHKCDKILQSVGLESILPAIFQTEPITDVVLLHSALFSLQYACAMTWMGAGISPSALVGHSFGQLTALAVSGVLSLRDGITLVTGRAKLMQAVWGAERGSMISIRADVRTLDRLMLQEADGLDIACFNGRTSHVVVGTSDAVDRLQACLEGESIRYKRLNVSHGFHSKFTEPLLPGLEELAEQLTFCEPMIPLETCSKDSSWSAFDAVKIVQHTRTPVYFAEAVDRLTTRLGPCTWLEAGSGSSITGMVRHTLDSSASASHLFQAVQLGADNAVGALADTTLSLWKAGHRVQFWPFDRSQRPSGPALDIPPYQFEKTRHWLDWKDTVSEQQPVVKEASTEFLRFIEGNEKAAEFRVRTQHEKYSFFVKGHAAISEPLCPAPLYIDLAYQAASFVSSTSSTDKARPSVEDLEIQAPLGVSDRVIILRLQQPSISESSWSFSFRSKPTDGAADEQLHATGTVVLRTDDSKTSAEFARYCRLVNVKRCRELMEDPECQVLQGPVVYQLFSKVVTYADHYKGVQSIYASGSEVAGRVRLPQVTKDPELRRPLLVDGFIQTSGIHVNCLSDVGPKEVFVCNKVDRVQPGPAFTKESVVADASWMVYSSSHAISDKEVSNDIFVFNAATEDLAMFILGARFTRVLVSSLVRVLSRANSDGNELAKVSTEKPPIKPPVKAPGPAPKLVVPSSSSKVAVPDLMVKLKTTLSQMIEVPVADIRDGDMLGDLGVDSLLGTEVLNEINEVFNVSITPEDFDLMTDVASISKALQALIGVQDSANDSEGMAVSVCSSSDNGLGIATPAITTPDDSVTRLVDLVSGHLECEEVTGASNLADLGLDSILSIELATDIKKIFGTEVDVSKLDVKSTFSDLVELALPGYMEAALTAVPTPTRTVVPRQSTRKSDILVETVLFKKVGQTPLYADIYYPPSVSDTPRPIALMVHGGGHIMLSRKDIRPKQTAHLHSLGFLPISIDYRLCPESPLIGGPMRDVTDALAWARTELPTLPLRRQDMKIDTSRVVLVGWSTGGHLAMTTAYTTIERGLAPPTAILAFYCATDFEDPVWSTPNYPENSEALSKTPYNLLEGVQPHPITAYNVPSSARAVGGWMAPQDARSRIVLHMNWKGQFMPVLLRGLPARGTVSDAEADALLNQPQPPAEEIQRASPYAQITKGVYKTPTFIIHGTADNLIPYSQSVRTIKALRAQGVKAGIAIPEGKIHLFDMYRDADGSSWEVVRKGYEFLVDVVFGEGC